MRRVPALMATAGLVIATLSACSSGPGGSCETPVHSGAASKLVSSTGEFGSTPNISFPTPLKTTTTQRSILIDGTGTALQPNQKIQFDLSIFNGTTGKILTKTDYGKKAQASLVLNKQTLTGLTEGLECARVGSRVAITIAPKDGFGKKGNPNLGVSGTDTLVAVVDVRKAYLTRANGTPVPGTPGFPHVVLAPDGTPGISIPDDKKPPKKLKVAELKQGKGKTVKSGDTVTVNYTGVLWKQKTVFKSTWTSHAPESIATKGENSKSPVPAGFIDAIIGKKVGSQVVVIIPPSEGYGSKGSGAVPADATLFYVIDILGIG